MLFRSGVFAVRHNDDNSFGSADSKISAEFFCVLGNIMFVKSLWCCNLILIT